MSIVDNIKKRMQGPGEGEEGYGDENYSDNGYYTETFGSYEDVPEDDGTGMGQDNGYAMGGQGISLSGASGNSIEMKVVKPESFDCVAQIADHLLSGRTVVLNLETTSKEVTKRIVDFLSGVAYSIDGSLKKIATSAYVITPQNVSVGDAKLTARKKPVQKQEEETDGDEFGDY